MPMNSCTSSPLAAPHDAAGVTQVPRAVRLVVGPDRIVEVSCLPVIGKPRLQSVGIDFYPRGVDCFSLVSNNALSTIQCRRFVSAAESSIHVYQVSLSSDIGSSFCELGVL